MPSFVKVLNLFVKNVTIDVAIYIISLNFIEKSLKSYLNKHVCNFVCFCKLILHILKTINILEYDIF